MTIIEKRYGIPRSTLSGWFKNIKLSKRQKQKLIMNRFNALQKARGKAVLWHNNQKEKRLKEAENNAKNILNNININDKNIFKIAIAMLYLGEGAKKNQETAIGNSNPLILKFFLIFLKKIFNIDINKIRCELYLRADQNSKKIKKFWMKELNLPSTCFKQINIDKRTVGSKTYIDYNGVCNLRCGNVAIQRELLYLSKLFCEKIIQQK